MTPKISVVITSLNRPDYLRSCCRSVLDQDLDAIEVLICDDASDDDRAREEARELAHSDDRVRVIENKARLGTFKTVAHASTLIRGSYLAIVNDDDVWAPGFLSALAEPMEQDRSLVAAFCDNFVIDATGAVDTVATEASTRTYHRDTLAPGKHRDSARLAFGLSAFPTVVASLFRVSAIDWARYRSARFDVGGFYDLWLQCCVLGEDAPVWFVPERLACYRIHDGQALARPNLQLAQAMAWILEEVLGQDSLGSVEDPVLRGLARAHHAIGMIYLRRGQLRTARNYLWRACAYPPRARSVAALCLSGQSRLAARVRRRVLQ